MSLLRSQYLPRSLPHSPIRAAPSPFRLALCLYRLFPESCMKLTFKKRSKRTTFTISNITYPSLSPASSALYFFHSLPPAAESLRKLSSCIGKLYRIPHRRAKFFLPSVRRFPRFYFRVFIFESFSHRKYRVNFTCICVFSTYFDISPHLSRVPGV